MSAFRAISSPWKSGLCAAAAGLAVDQATKAAALSAFSTPRKPVHVLPFFDIVLVQNEGITFGIGSGAGPAFALAGVAFCLVVLLAVWLARSESRLTAIGLGLIIGGAVGNLIDRLRHGAVTDFLDFYIDAWHWPAFNFADVAIFCGVLLLILESVFIQRRIS